MEFSVSKLITLLILIGIVFFFVSSPNNKEGETANDFSSELIDGTTFNLSDLRGSYVLLDFWGSWCPPCRRDMPGVVKIEETYNGKFFKDANDFHVVSIALEKNDKHWRKATEKMGIDWKYQIVRTAKLVLTDALALKYQVKDLPSKFLIDPQGQIIGVNMKMEEIETILRDKLK